MKKNGLFNIILLLSIYLPFEDFILKWLPVSESVYLMLRQIPDIIIFCLLLLVILSALVDKKFPFAVGKRTYFIFLLFIAFAFLTIFLNHASFFNAIKNLKALVRYIFLLNIVLFCKPTEKQILLFIRVVILLAFIEGGIGYLQMLGGGFIRNLTKPRELLTETDITFSSLFTTTETFGTMAYTINYAFFLLTGLIFFLYFSNRLNRSPLSLYAGVLYLLFAIYFSGSRAAFITANASIILYYYMKQGPRRISDFVMLAMPLFIFGFALIFVEKGSTNEDFWFFLSPDFIETIESQRLGMVKVFWNYIGDTHLPYGLSPDVYHLESYIVRNYKLPPFFAESALNGIEDVSWIAFMFYYGLIGVALIVTFLLFVYNKLQNFENHFAADSLQHNMIKTCKTLLIMLILLNFISQAFEVRHFSFYIWMIIGLTISHCSHQYKSQIIAHS